jgi:transglutaminase-like putative cysteine protease
MTMLTLSSDDFIAMTPLADDSVAWDEAVEVTYLLHQRFHYDYPGPIADLHHRLIVVPREHHGDQERIAHRLDVEPAISEHADLDAFGNPVVTFFARRVERSIEFAHWSLVVRKRERGHIGAEQAGPEWRSPTALTAADEALRDAARALRTQHAGQRELAAAIVSFVFKEMRYVAGATDVETTAAEAFARREGVCQDFAHVALALARRCGLAARYVSGHLVGEGGTHAWVEFFLPSGTAAEIVAFDPTHDCRVNMKYIVVSVGRDYADVAPTSGVFTAPYAGELTSTTKRVGATHVVYANGSVDGTSSDVELRNEDALGRAVGG